MKRRLIEPEVDQGKRYPIRYVEQKSEDPPRNASSVPGSGSGGCRLSTGSYATDHRRESSPKLLRNLPEGREVARLPTQGL